MANISFLRILKNECKRIAVLLCVLFTAVVLYSGFPVSAAVTYKGSGTKNDPYLVETPAQLDGIRNNLSAFYKLNANIDMKGFKSVDPTPEHNYAGGFVPIGMHSVPFTGTFTCDVDASGNPKYSITNLSVTNNAGKIYGHAIGSSKSYSDYVQGKSYWEAALFGTTNGATVSNIMITNAAIFNTVLGQNQMNSDHTINLGQGSGELSAAILIGRAVSSTITNCTVRGKVTGANNAVAALCGIANSCKISDCAAYADITSTGLWCCGGITGSADKTSYIRTFFEGNIRAKSCSAPGLFATGSGNATFTDCYAKGTIDKGETFVANLENAKKVTNCYSSGTRTDGKTAAGNGSFTNSYIVQGGYSSQLPAVSKAELKTKFTGLAAWDVSGDLPTIKKQGKGASGSTGTQQGGTTVQPGGTTAGNGQNTIVDAGASVVLINGINVIEQMADLPDAYNIGEEDFEKYLELFNAYSSMPVSMKADFTEEQIAAITEIGEVVSKEVMQSISKQIKKLPDQSALKAKDKDILNGIVKLYKLVPAEFRSEMDADVYEKLCASLRALGMEGLTVEAGAAADTLMKYVMILIIAINLLLLAGTVVLVVLLTRMLVKKKQAAVSNDIFSATQSNDSTKG